MASPPTDNEPKTWHRYFAIECNNRAWELSERHRSDKENQEMLDLAHAAAWHWKAVGTELNQMRATTLLARAHALVGHGQTSLTYAKAMRSYFLGRETPSWELVFVHSIYAHAAYLVGDLEGHRSAYREAAATLTTVTNEEDRKIVLATFETLPKPPALPGS